MNDNMNNVPSSRDGQSCGDGFFSNRRGGTFLNFYNNMLNRMDRLEQEVNRTFMEHLGDGFDFPRSSFSNFPFFGSRFASSLRDQERDPSQSMQLYGNAGSNFGNLNQVQKEGGRSIDVLNDRSDSKDALQGFGSNLFGKFDDFYNWKFGNKNMFPCVPRVDITDESSRYVVQADLPGMARKDVKVNVENGRMNISGSKSEEKKEEGKEYVFQERCNSQFYRSFPLPKDIKEEHIKANFNENGTLRVTIPKDEKAARENRSINIE